MNWQDGLRKFRRRLNEMPRAVVVGTVEEMGNRIIDRTPVLSGRLVQNWKLTEGVPNTEEDTGVGPARGVPKQRLQAALRNVSFKQRLFFTNPVPYAFYIEFGVKADGSRPTVARMMVRLTLAEFTQIYLEAVRKVRSEFK